MAIWLMACTMDTLTGVAQGIVTGTRGLCNGLGPALFGFIFYLFNVDLNEFGDGATSPDNESHPAPTKTFLHSIHEVRHHQSVIIISMPTEDIVFGLSACSSFLSVLDVF